MGASPSQPDSGRWIALDHVRALAAFLVFSWHFIHGQTGAPVAFDGTPAVFPLALIDEGHTGVSLFMVLSGYLFARILDRRAIDYGAFLASRAIRLLPMLVVAIFVSEVVRGIALGAAPDFVAAYGRVAAGLFGIDAPLENGLWSIAVEAHFYILLPIMMLVMRRWRWGLVGAVMAMMAIRLGWYVENGTMQHAAYYTLVGRFDQFALGMTAFMARDAIRGRHHVALGIAALFCAFYAWFDAHGGWYGGGEALWIVLPTIEGAAYAGLIAYYETSFAPADRGVSRFVGRIGRYSYAIYLLHFFVVFRAAELIDRHVMSLANFYVALAWSMAAFVAMVPVGWLCWKVVEEPFLKRRRAYVRPVADVMSSRSSPAIS